MKKSAKQQTEFLVERVRGKLYMMCCNSESDSKYHKGRTCYEMVQVRDKDVSYVVCWKCMQLGVPAPDIISQPQKKTGYPKGWHLKKEFVDVEGNVFHYGAEQPQLKGTAEPTVIEPKKRTSIKQKHEAEKAERDALLNEVASLKLQLKKTKSPADRKKIENKINRIQKSKAFKKIK